MAGFFGALPKMPINEKPDFLPLLDPLVSLLSSEYRFDAIEVAVGILDIGPRSAMMVS